MLLAEINFTGRRMLKNKSFDYVMLVNPVLLTFINIFLSASTIPSDSTTLNLTTTEVSPIVSASNFFLENYIIVGFAGVALLIVLIIIISLLIRKIRDRCCFDTRLLETYSSINYDDESLDNELDDCDNLVYTSCKLYVGDDLGVDSDFTNSEPEYDCMSVDGSVNASASPIVDWSNRSKSVESEKEEMAQSLKTLPFSFWKR